MFFKTYFPHRRIQGPSSAGCRGVVSNYALQSLESYHLEMFYNIFQKYLDDYIIKKYASQFTRDHTTSL